MKETLYGVAFLMSLFAFSQVRETTKWSNSLSNDNPQKGDTIDVVFQATIEPNWYLYSSDFDPDLGPGVATFEFEENDSYQLVGEIVPINPKQGYDSIFEGEYTYFRLKGVFKQKVLIKNANYKISGYYEYQTCSDIDGLCITYDEDFKFQSSGSTEGIESTEGESKKGGLLKSRSTHDPYSLLSFMLVAFLAGLAALLTPCVFPMIPMTVTYFSKKPGRVRNGIFYGVSIIVIYVLVGSVLAPFMGPETANELATAWLPNVIFFVVFVVFALSFFGLFEINLPHGFVNKVDRMGDKGGMIGIFFMSLTLVLVSFSCTGPLVGSILVESAGGQILKPILGMFAFSAAFAIPFTLFALFPGWLNSLPKSGGWLNSVKVVLGFLELAFAFKFLSIADQAYHWRILDREVYLAIWIAIFTLMGFYMLGKIRLPGDSDSSRTTVGGLVMAIFTFSFVIYLIPGLWGAPLKSLAGYLPPLSTHDFNLTEIIRKNSGGSGIVGNASNICEDPLYDEFLELPHGLTGYFDYQQALSCAKEQNKPIFIDFTGHGCVNCREMEQKVWSDEKVIDKLRTDFIVLALYVDDKTELPEEAWYNSDYDGKMKKSIGKQNADFQISKFNNNAQPFYVLLDEDENLLADPIGYDLNVSNFVAFLEQGLENFRR